MKLKRHIKSLLWLILITNITFIEKAVATDTLTAETVLFKVTHPNSDKTSYLFGTHHAFGKSFFDSLQNATEALKTSDFLIKENLNIPGHLAEDIINRRSSTTKWTKYLIKDDFEFVKNIFATSEVNINKMTPTELFAFLSRYYKQRVCLSKNASDNFLSLDDYIGSVAEKYQLELVGLETTEEQIDLINKDVQGMPRKVHKKRLSNMISRIKANRSDNCAEIDWYKNMDFDYRLESSCQNTLVLTDRNNRWMNQLEGYLKSNNCFIAVGLSHLMFKCGLINQLNNLGYTITPVAVK